MIPRLIHQTARTADISWEERQLAERMRRRLPGWRYALWTDTDNRALIARSFPQHLDRYDAIEAGVMKADIARLGWLHERGGFYFDTDYKLIRPIDDALLDHGCILPTERGTATLVDPAHPFSDDYKVGNAVIAAVPRHPLFAAFIEGIFSQVTSQQMTEIELMNISGPQGLTRFYREHHARFDDVWLAPQSLFMPDLRLGGLSFTREDTTLGVHLCWGSWRTKHRIRNIRNRARRLITAVI